MTWKPTQFACWALICGFAVASVPVSQAAQIGPGSPSSGSQLDPSDADDPQDRLVGSGAFTIGNRQSLTDLTVWGDYFDFTNNQFLSQSEINSITDDFTVGFHEETGGNFDRTADVSANIGGGTRQGIANFNNDAFTGLQWDFDLQGSNLTLDPGTYIMSLINDPTGEPGGTTSLWTWVGSSNDQDDLYISAGSGESFTQLDADEKAFELQSVDVPVPASFGLLGAGLISLGVFTRRRHYG